MSVTAPILQGLMSAQPAHFSPAGLGLLSVTQAVPQWIGVRQRFEQFHWNLALTELQYQDGVTKRAGVVACLNRSYYGTSSLSDNSFLVGSWGKALPSVRRETWICISCCQHRNTTDFRAISGTGSPHCCKR